MRSAAKRLSICAGVAVLMTGVMASWGPTLDTVHFGDGYWHNDLGVVTGRTALWFYERSERELSSQSTQIIDTDGGYYTGSVEESADVERVKAAQRRIKALLGPKAALHLVTPSPGLSVLLQDGDKEVLALADEMGSKFDKEWGLKFFLARRTGKIADLKKLLAETTNDLRKPYLLYAIADLSSTGRISASVWLQIANDYPQSLRAPAAKMRAVGSVLLDYKLGQSPTPKALQDADEMEKLIAPMLNDSKSPYHCKAIGWRGYVERVRGEEGKAARWYLKQMLAAKTLDQRTEAISSFKVSMRVVNPSQARWLGEVIRSEPELLAPYLEFRIHYADASIEEASTLWELAAEVEAKNGPVNVPADACAMFADAAYWQHNHAQAVKWADRAIQSKKPSAEAIGYYVRGSVRRKKGKLQQAVADYNACLARPSYPALVTGAKENKAICLEKLDRLDEALDMYFDLGYSADIAYMLDMRMTPEQIEGYIAERPRHPKRPVLRYSLALRWLRKQEFAKAKRVFASIPASQLKVMAFLDERDYFASYSGKTDMLHDPREVLATWEAKKWQMNHAATPEKRAKTAYELASYFYNNRSLLLYNPTLWLGGRERAMSYGVADYYYGTGASAFRDDPAFHQAMEQHGQEHECLNQARKICLEILEKYPDSSVSPQAAYRAATASSRLADLNPWWRDSKRAVPLLTDAIRLMKLVAKEHPNSPLHHEAEKYAQVFQGDLSQALNDY